MSHNPFERSSKMIYTFQKLLKLERVLDKALNKHWLCAYCMPCSKKSPRLEMWILISQALHPVSAALSEMGEVLMQRGEQAAAGFLRAQSSLPGSQETQWATYPELLKPEWAWESCSVAAKKKISVYCPKQIKLEPLEERPRKLYFIETIHICDGLKCVPPSQIHMLKP